MNYLIIQSICITTFITTMLSATLRDESKSQKQPNIEELIDRLLKSDKFEKIADRIAEKAVNRIITLQNSHKIGDIKSAKEDDPPKPRTVTSQEIKKDVKEKEDRSNEKSKEIISDKNATTNKTEKKDFNGTKHDKHTEKSKIDTIAAIQKFSEFPSVDLSLNYKHFTIQEKLESMSLHTKPKSKRHHKKDSHKKSHGKDDKESDDSALLHPKAHPGEELKTITDDSDLSIDERKKSRQEKNLKSFGKHTKERKANKESKIKQNEKKELAEKHSDSSQSDTSNSSSNEIELTTTAIAVQRTNENKTKDTKNIFKAESNETSNSETNELNISEFLTKVTKTASDTENSSQESEGVENMVSDIIDSANVDAMIDKNMKQDKKDSEKKDNVKDINKIDVKHKVRKQNGKLYAFAQSSDYDEYHDKLSKILQSVKDKSADRQTVNKDLLDLIEQ